jgi:diacylglycerol diphosphate phosphatase/phosphatidate phosphatase
MGLFNKHTRQQPGTTGPAGTTGTSNGTSGGGFFGRRGGNRNTNDHVNQSYSMMKRPSFGQWLKYTWLDLLTMVIMGAIGLGVSYSFP